MTRARSFFPRVLGKLRKVHTCAALFNGCISPFWYPRVRFALYQATSRQLQFWWPLSRRPLAMLLLRRYGATSLLNSWKTYQISLLIIRYSLGTTLVLRIWGTGGQYFCSWLLSWFMVPLCSVFTWGVDWTGELSSASCGMPETVQLVPAPVLLHTGEIVTVSSFF
jgi:hypothetical protein